MLFVAALFVSCLVTLGMMVFAWQRRDVRTAPAIAVLMGGLSWWTFCYALLILHIRHPDVVPTLFNDPLFWFRLMFVGVSVLPAALIIFVLQYTGYRQRIGLRLIGLVAVIPTLCMIANFTEGFGHQWFMGDFEPGGESVFKGGPAFWLHTLYSYIVMFIAYFLLIRFAIQNPQYRRQALLFLAGNMVVLILNVVTIMQWMPESWGKLDLSPFGFVVASMIMALNIRREGFLDLMPVARSLVFERMADGVLVTDTRGRLLDQNPAAQALFTRAGVDMSRGRLLQEALPGMFQGGRPAEELTLQPPGDEARRPWQLNVRRTELRNRRSQVKGYVYGFRDVTELKEVEDSLRQQLADNEALRRALKEESIRDPLTGLYNRRWLDEVLEQEIPRALREQQPLSFCVMDLDHFKQVNDNWGHDVGDRILVALARLLTEGSRKHDVAARFGGEEFVLVLPGLDATRGREVVERLLKAFSELDFGAGGPDNLTFSAGLAVVPDHASDRENLFKMADRALYRAKEAGRNRVVVQDIA
ncbi:diguanylate cyclase [Marinobacter sp. LN3S78]|uniref:diguanylate cyclase n=1 Tax=Marinobacter sp. LN3S78 TaxID=3382300 RepID=UPI00387ACA1A